MMKRAASSICALSLTLLLFLPVSCDLYQYGRLEGADITEVLRPEDPESASSFETLMASLSGVWYSHNAGIGRLDGYRIGKWEDFEKLVEDSGKIDLFPDYEFPYTTYTDQSGSDVPGHGDYFVFHDDTVYGESGDGQGGSGGWEDLVTRYVGIVRAVNVFNGDANRGAVIIEYLKGCVPTWDHDLADGSHPFFGIYYRVLGEGRVQMANAVDLAALYAGRPYYTEKASLQEAIDANTVENEAEFISWGVVIPQDREPE
jgi:hypothetical protein